MKNLHRRVLESAVAWSFLGTFLRVGASVFVLPLVLRTLPAEHLGMWYIFGSLGSFAMLLDLGFEATITRMASYVWAGTPGLAAFGLHDGPASGVPNRALFRDLVATLRAYYFALGLFVLLLLELGGSAWVWARSEGIPEASTVRGAWVIYALGVSLNFVGGRWPALISGIGALRAAQQVNVAGLLLYYIIAVAGLTAGYGLWSLVAAMLMMGVFVRALGRLVFVRTANLPGSIPAPRFNREIFSSIWPNAWRTGLVSVGAFLIIQANTLICSAFLDLSTTASYGISFQLVTMLVGLSAVWVQVKIPLISQLRLQGKGTEIAIIFARRLRFSIISYFCGTLVIIYFAPWILHAIGSKTTLLPKNILTSLAVIQFLEMHHSLYGQLVLTENRNPFLRPALVSGLLIVGASLMLTPRIGVWGMLLAAGGVQACFNNWWPVVRAVRGLNLADGGYWSYFFSLRDPWKTV